MKQERLNLYYVDMHYIRDLHRADDRVRSVSPQEKKMRQFQKVGTDLRKI